MKLDELSRLVEFLKDLETCCWKYSIYLRTTDGGILQPDVLSQGETVKVDYQPEGNQISLEKVPSKPEDEDKHKVESWFASLSQSETLLQEERLDFLVRKLSNKLRVEDPLKFVFEQLGDQAMDELKATFKHWEW